MLWRATCLQLVTIFSFLGALLVLCVLVFELVFIKPSLFLESSIGSSSNISTTHFIELHHSAQMLQAEQQQQYWQERRASLEKTLDLIPGYRQAMPNCSRINHRRDFSMFRAARRWNIDSEKLRQIIFTDLTENNLKCRTLKEKLTFFAKPLSREEEEYPLSYGMLVYDNAMQVIVAYIIRLCHKCCPFTIKGSLLTPTKDFRHLLGDVCTSHAENNKKRLRLDPQKDSIEQSFVDWDPQHKEALIYLLLSAIYQPQNAYCIAVDSKSSEQFKADMDLLADCFPNIFVMQINQVEWYTYSVVRGVWNCLRYLSQLSHPWKYYQYLSGVDLPLKTNLEMVRIFKQLNGTPNTDIRPIPDDRIERVINKSSPLKLYKSSLSALLSRESIDGMIQSKRVRDLLDFIQQVECPDEALWATILGNPEELVLPGTFNGSTLYSRSIEEQNRLPRHCGYREKVDWMKNVSVEEPFPLRSYYISRFQVWMFTPNTRCHGKYTHYSCVYGILDVSTLLARPELVAHKFYLNVEPACYFCVYQHIRQRALDVDSQTRFKGHVYAQLPQVQMSRGVQPKDLKFYFTKCLMDD